jgi:hypothetical protein
MTDYQKTFEKKTAKQLTAMAKACNARYAQGSPEHADAIAELNQMWCALNVRLKMAA